MARLPVPGSDEGNWGDVLNDFLTQSHNTDGSLKSSAVSAANPSSGATIADGSVGSAQLADGSVINAKLGTAVQSTLAEVDSKYVRPAGGIPATDLTAAVRTSLSDADTSVQSVNGVAPTAGNVTLSAANVGALTQAAADAIYTESQSIRSIVQISQTDYDNLSQPDASTLYIIT